MIRIFLFFSILVSPFISLLVHAEEEVHWIYADWVQGGMVIGKTNPEAEVFLNNKKIRVGKKGIFVFGFGRDEVLKQQLTLLSKRGKAIKSLSIKKREYNIERINGIPKKIMQPSETDLKRIRSENSMVGRARKTKSQGLDFMKKFIWPADGKITGVYGSQRIFNGESKRPHFGLDIAGSTGAPVLAPSSGVVTLVHPNMFYSGGTLLIDHGMGISSTFIHLSEILVKEGDKIQQGELIARIGSTGRATGPHLDWRINWFAVRLDPQLLMQ